MTERVGANSLADAVDAIAEAMADISRIFADPHALAFDAVRTDMERLEEILSGQKAYADAAFAYLCDRDGAGRIVGANQPAAYLRDVLGLSQAEAMGRLRRGEDLFAPVEDTTPDDEFLFAGIDPDSPDADEAAAAVAAAAEEARRKAEEEREAKRRAKEAALKAAKEKQDIINRELMNLRDDAVPGRPVILAKALDEANRRSPEDLRKFVRRLVDNANAAGRKNSPDKPQSDFDARKLIMGKPDSAGMCRVTIDLPAGEAAVLKAALDLGRGGIGDKSGSSEQEPKDTRTMSQRRFDQFMHIVTNFSGTKAGSQGGIGTVVVGMTLDDLNNADHTTTFMTNTGISLTAYDMLRLGFTGTDFIAQLDSVTGVPLSLGRTRLASVHQRIALLAMQGVCAWHGCDRPMSELDIHHMESFFDGGLTDIENLIALCREHHMCNNDRRDGRGNKGYVDRDPETGRVGVVPADGGPMRFNETVDAHESIGHKLRKRQNRQHPPPGSTPGDPPDPVLFPVA
ncbi:DUF222 domain-containing protein [Corynebacterium sp. CCUG 71335]|uniref:HNH endonuclease signature motif containing protein n=1 Tax=Corynebacterium sp. CCUG 71335 TaxID=2823892 RepID=UPI002108E64A|nr:HNH endonuclease signature motif containing protein [Corynebacterium sp. CCUG 71335]MCQ4620550.1 DUF222 domain-containing protein [Corynebacterium sp. CCUG 71335]